MNANVTLENEAVMLADVDHSEHLDRDGGLGAPFDLLDVRYADIGETLLSLWFQ